MKGLSEYVLTIVISLIVAMIGLALLWVFLQNAAKGGQTFASDIIKEICNKIGLLKYIVGCE